MPLCSGPIGGCRSGRLRATTRKPVLLHGREVLNRDGMFVFGKWYWRCHILQLYSLRHPSDPQDSMPQGNPPPATASESGDSSSTSPSAPSDTTWFWSWVMNSYN